MIKLLAQLKNEGNLYAFGLTEANLNRLKFNNEPIFFDFGYASHPELFGLILYMGQFREPDEIFQNAEAVEQCCLPFLDPKRGVTVESLRVFPLAQSVMEQFRSTQFWAFGSQIQITSPGDKQLVFVGRDEQDIEKYFQDAGLLTPQTKRTYKGFGGDRNAN